MGFSGSTQVNTVLQEHRRVSMNSGRIWEGFIQGSLSLEGCIEVFSVEKEKGHPKQGESHVQSHKSIPKISQ